MTGKSSSARTAVVTAPLPRALPQPPAPPQPSQPASTRTIAAKFTSMKISEPELEPEPEPEEAQPEFVRVPRCYVCGRKFPEGEWDLQESHSDVCPARQVPTPAVPANLICPFCNCVWPTSDRLREHLPKCNGSECFPCPDPTCDAPVYGSAYILAYHMHGYHDGPKPYEGEIVLDEPAEEDNATSTTSYSSSTGSSGSSYSTGGGRSHPSSARTKPVPKQCGPCKGSGRKKCGFCSGTGKFQKKTCTHCQGGTTKCNSCNGRGK